MGLEDIYIITTILGLAVFSVGARALARYGKNLINPADPPSTGYRPTPVTPEAGTVGAPAVESATGLSITFTESGKQFQWDSTMECLLDFIQSKGIEVECMCGAGECGSCRTRLIEGEVIYRQEPKIAPGDGYCLLCVSVPKSDLVLAR